MVINYHFSKKYAKNFNIDIPGKAENID